MNGKRVATLARRVIRQIAHDRRTVALVILAPMMILTLGAILFRAESAPIPLGIVNEDQGLTVPGAGTIALGQRIADELAAGDAFTVVTVQNDEIDARLRDGTVDGVVVLPADFTAQLVRSSDHHATIDLRLEGSNPIRSRLITAGVTAAAIKAVAELVSGGLGSATGLGAAGVTAAGQTAELPVTVNTTYLYASATFDTLDYIAPVYIAFLAFFFVFLLTCVSFLRERSQGTMERLLATPATRLEIVLGYLGGLGLFALIQVAIIGAFTIWVLKIHYLGSLALIFLDIALLALVGVGLGILSSTFARTEFQVIQFIPIIIIPQALLSGMIWPVEEMPSYLQPFAYIMPLTYANRALRNVMLKGQGLDVIWPDLLILVGMAVVIVALGALTVRREVA
jgi:ABC-2 type transport system permease protein